MEPSRSGKTIVSLRASWRSQADCDVRCAGYRGCMSAYSLDLREKIVEPVKKGLPRSETARRFGVDRATVKRYCKQLDECGTLEPRKAPGKAPKLDEKASKLLLGGLQERPWATHSQRAEFLCCVGCFGERSHRLPNA